jgi:hypothetical protein
MRLFQIQCFISRTFKRVMLWCTLFHCCFRCLDPSLAIRPVFEQFSTVVITSGTISPLDMYPKMLQFTPVHEESYQMTLTRNAFLPLVCVFIHLGASIALPVIRSSHEEATKLLLVRGLKSETTLLSFATLEVFSSNTAKLCPME